MLRVSDRLAGVLSVWRGPGVEQHCLNCTHQQVRGLRTPSVRTRRLEAVVPRFDGHRQEDGRAEYVGEEHLGHASADVACHLLDRHHWKPVTTLVIDVSR